MPDFAEPTRPPRLGRRTLMRGAGLGVFGVASVAVLPLFGTDGAAQDPATCRAQDVSDVDKKLIVSNWPAYIDPRRKKYVLIKSRQHFRKAPCDSSLV